MRSFIFLLLFVFFNGCSEGEFVKVREYMLKNYQVEELHKEIYIDKASLHVKGKYALLNRPPKIKDGSDSYKYFLDTGYTLCLEKKKVFGKLYMT